MRQLALIAALFTAAVSAAQGYAPSPAASASQFDVYNTATTGALTLYVDSLGSDSNACTSTGSNACLTIQGALNKVPKRVRHVVTINIGSGNFAGAYITGFSVETGASTANGAYINLVGTLATASGLGGSMTGTFTAGTAGSGLTYGTATMAGAGWTINALQGYMVETLTGTGSGQIKQIASNSATVITIAGAFSPAPDATTTFAIRDWGTVINSAVNLPATVTSAEGSATGGGLFVDNLVTGYQTGLTVDKIHFSMAGKKGIHVITPGSKILVRRVKCSTTTQNCVHVPAGGDVTVNDSTKGTGASVLLSTGTSAGYPVAVRVNNSTVFGAYGLLSTGPGGYTASNSNYVYNISGSAYDLYSPNDGFILSDRVDCVTPGASKRGIDMGASALSSRAAGSIGVFSLDVSNCGTGIRIRGEGGVVAAGVISGTGNTTGYSILEGGQMKIASTSTLTGTTEISIDGTSTDYATIRAAGPPKLASSTLGSRVWEP